MKIQATGNDNSSPFNRLPDEIIVVILNKLIDLKTLCFCYAVCKRFSSIVVQIDTISYNSPLVDIVFDDGVPSSNGVKDCFQCVSFQSAFSWMKKFCGLKSLCINLRFPAKESDNRYLFKWKAKFGMNKIDSFLIFSPRSIHYNTDNGNVSGHERVAKTSEIMIKCLRDGGARVGVLFKLITLFPLLEKVSIVDSARLGIVSVDNVGQISEIRKCLLSPCEAVQQKLKLMRETFGRASKCYFPSLELPVSKYLMKDVTMILVEHKTVPDGCHSFTNFDENESHFEDKEHHAAYTEAVNVIFNKHRGSIRRLPW